MNLKHEQDEKNQRALKALQDLLERLAADDTNILHVFKMYLAENEDRYYEFAKKMQSAWMKTATGLVLALLVGGYIVGQVNQAGKDARAATTDLRATVRENRKLIKRLEVVATQAQENGSEATKEICRKIEDFKVPIREVLAQSGATRFLHLFRRESCKNLPNAKPITP